MTKFDVNIKKLNENAVIPTYGTEYAAGADLYACMEEAVTINPGHTCFIKTGLAMEVPVGYAGLIYARSGLACKKGLAPANKVGVSIRIIEERLWLRFIIIAMKLLL